MTINIKAWQSYAQPITVQFLTEDSDIDECNHAGSVAEAMEFTRYSTYEGVQVPDDTAIEYVEVCDKCQAWQDLDGSWRDNNESEV